MRIARATLLFVALLAMVAATVTAQVQATPTYRLIVHPANSTVIVPRSFVLDAFLKRVTRWRDGETIRPVDLDPNSATRRAFSQEVLGRSAAAVRSYWQQMIFSGRGLPPVEVDSDEEVVSYVLSYRGAIGYVSVRANLRGARVLSVQ